MKERLQTLGKRAYAIPFVVALVVFCVLGTAIAPMMRMAPAGLPVAVVNLDEGAQLPTGETMVAGDFAVAALQEMAEGAAGEGGEAPMAWTELSSRAELDEALAAGEYYGALVIPADFTERQMAGRTALASALGEGISSLMAQQSATAGASGIGFAAQAAAPDAAAAAAAVGAETAPDAAAAAATGAGAPPSAVQAALAQQVQGVIAQATEAQAAAEKPTVELVLNTVKSPLVANTLQSSMPAALAAQGIEVEVTSLGDAGDGANPLTGILSVQMMVMPLFIMSLLMAFIASAIGWPRREGVSRAEKAKAAGGQVAFAALASLAAAVLSYGIVAWLGGVEAPATAILFLWLASFCLMLACIGLSSLALPLGIVVMVCVFALGMATTMLPVEMMPTFWADWVAPWAPQAAIGEGLRNIMLANAGAFDVGCGTLAAWGCAGLVALLLSVALPARSREGEAA